MRNTKNSVKYEQYDTSKLEEMKTEMRKRQIKVRKKLSRLPEGKLMMANVRGNVRPMQVIYKNGIKTRKGIGLKTDLVYDLAHKAYLERELKGLDNNIEVVDQLITKWKDIDQQSILQQLPKNYNLLKPEWVVNPQLRKKDFKYPKPVLDGSVPARRAPLNLKDLCKMPEYSTQFESEDNITAENWAEMQYCANSIEGRKHFSRKGIMTRSKSEAMLLDLYDDLGIYYHYDETMLFNNLRLSPDIVALRQSDGMFIYHEHLGLQTEGYIMHNQSKAGIYYSAGVYAGKNLILTYDNEEGAINMRLVEAIVRETFFGKG